MRALILDGKIQAAIDAALVEARGRIKTRALLERAQVPFDGKQELTLADRPAYSEADAIALRGVPVLIPVGFRANISFEEQPIGLCRHLSISVDRPGQMPSVPAVEMIAQAFGLDMSFSQSSPKLEGNFWLEEFEPGHHALHIVWKDEP